MRFGHVLVSFQRLLDRFFLELFIVSSKSNSLQRSPKETRRCLHYSWPTSSFTSGVFSTEVQITPFPPCLKQFSPHLLFCQCQNVIVYLLVSFGTIRRPCAFCSLDRSFMKAIVKNKSEDSDLTVYELANTWTLIVFSVHSCTTTPDLLIGALIID